MPELIENANCKSENSSFNCHKVVKRKAKKYIINVICLLGVNSAI